MRTNLHHQFLWSAQQAVEKYLKCAHLLNIGPVLRFSNRHDLVPLFEAVADFSGVLIPDLSIPHNVFVVERYGRSVKPELYRSFVERLEQEGSPDVRYRQYSISPEKYDLHRLDELCFLLRRICMPIDMEATGLEKTYRQLLKESPNWQPHPTLKALNPYGSQTNKELLEILHWCNFSFSEDTAIEEGKFANGRPAQNSEIFMTVQRLPDPEAAEALEWLINSVKLSRQDRHHIRENIQNCASS